MYHWSELSKNYPASSIRKMAKLAAQFDDTLMLTIPNQSSIPKAFQEFDEAGRMRPSPLYDRIVDV